MYMYTFNQIFMHQVKEFDKVKTKKRKTSETRKNHIKSKNKSEKTTLN